MSEQQVTDIMAKNGCLDQGSHPCMPDHPCRCRAEAYTASRRSWAEETAKIVPTAVPWPKRRLSTWHIRPAPGTDEDTDPQD